MRKRSSYRLESWNPPTRRAPPSVAIAAAPDIAAGDPRLPPWRAGRAQKYQPGADGGIRDRNRHHDPAASLQRGRWTDARLVETRFEVLLGPASAAPAQAASAAIPVHATAPLPSTARGRCGPQMHWLADAEPDAAMRCVSLRHLAFVTWIATASTYSASIWSPFFTTLNCSGFWTSSTTTLPCGPFTVIVLCFGSTSITSAMTVT
jgi:hypothetical protein